LEKTPRIPSLEAVGLDCSRGGRALFSNLSFTLRAGMLLRIAGANGSGKTSLLRIACGLLEPSGGEVLWAGENIRRLQEEFWRQLVYIGHAHAIKDDLSAVENLEVACILAGIDVRREQLGEALRRLGLAGFERLPGRVLSQGQRRRVALSRLALAESAPLWILDEPFTALDAAALDCVRTLMAEQVSRGGSVLYTTHYETKIVSETSLSIELNLGPTA
jgi:heme exporter protein A